MPYHSYAEAHRRLVASVGIDSTYGEANHPGLFVLVARIARSTMAASEIGHTGVQRSRIEIPPGDCV